jgi:membrane protease YdiL (CAAX protease family)
MITQLNTKRILIFLAFAIGIPWTAALVISQTSLMETDPLKAGSLANYIFISMPALANVATRLITKEGWGHLWLRPNFKRGWRSYLAAWLLPFLAVIVGGVTFYLLFSQSFDPNFDVARKLVAGTTLATVANPLMILLSIVQTVMFLSGPLINGVLSIGEEFGWRAYLLPRLMEHFTGASADGAADSHEINHSAARKASLLIGLIWGVWHWPLFFMSARVDPEFSPLFPLVYLVFTCSASVLLSWVTLRSGSIWPASIGHGTINATSGLTSYMLKGPAIPFVGPGITGLLGGLGYIALALVLYFSRRAFTGKNEANSQYK